MIFLRLVHAWDDFCHENEKNEQLDFNSIFELLIKHDLSFFEYEKWRKYYHIFDSFWFFRTWIIQKISFARRAIVMFEYYVFDWNYLTKSIKFCDRYEFKNRKSNVFQHNFLYDIKNTFHMIKTRIKR